jgi:hypothetical protein
LTTKDQSEIFERTTKTNPPPTRSEEPDPGSYSWKLLLIKDARVHYVVLKQQPQTTHPTHTPEKGANRAIGAARKPETNKPGNHHSQSRSTPGPVASGPNSVPNTTHQQSNQPAFHNTPPSPKEQQSIRTHNRPVPPGTYPLIFHP